MLTFLHNNLRWIGAGFLLTYCSSFGQTFFIAASIGEWQDLFQLSHGEIGRLYMFATLASAACLPFLGRIVDVLPEHQTVAICIPMLAIATVLAATAPNISALLVAIFLLRLFGQGMMTHIALTATGRWYSAQRGRAVSLVVLGHQGGEATLPLLIGAVSIAFGFQAGWFLGTAFLLLLGLPVAYFALRTPPVAESESVVDSNGASNDCRHWSREEVLRDPCFWLLLVGVLAPPFIGTSIFYHQDYFAILNGWPPHLFGLGLSTMAVMTVLFALLCGVLVDRFRAIAVLPYFLLPMAMSCFAMAFGASTWSFFLAMGLLGISYGLSSTLLGAVWPEIYGTQHLGSIRSVIVSAMVLSTAAGPGLTGTLIDWGIALPTQIAWLGMYCLVAILFMTFASARVRKRLPQ